MDTVTATSSICSSFDFEIASKDIPGLQRTQTLPLSAHDARSNNKWHRNQFRFVMAQILPLRVHDAGSNDKWHPNLFRFQHEYIPDPFMIRHAYTLCSHSFCLPLTFSAFHARVASKFPVQHHLNSQLFAKYTSNSQVFSAVRSIS